MPSSRKSDNAQRTLTLDYSTKYSPNPQDFQDLLYIETEKASERSQAVAACFKHVDIITIFTSRRRGVRITKLASFAIISDTRAAERCALTAFEGLLRSDQKARYSHAYAPPPSRSFAHPLSAFERLGCIDMACNSPFGLCAQKVHYLHAYVPPLPLVRVRAERMRAASGQLYGARFASLCAVAPLASLATALFSCTC
ncbi:hypothetical protein FB451DRAFT_1557530 [Mycena latifolia]|nr:hypothetical protein FB451DRAFT_1557530 [Mycena latifolia]